MNGMTRPMFHEAAKGFVLIAMKEGNGDFQSALSSVWGHNLEM